MTSRQATSLSGTMTNNYLRSLPLYDTLVAKLSQRVNQGQYSITPEYKLRLTTILSNLDSTRATEVALLLIHCYYLVNPDSNPFTPTNCSVKTSSRSNVSNLPYDIKISSSGKGFSFELEKIPMQVQALLGIYCCI